MNARALALVCLCSSFAVRAEDAVRIVVTAAHGANGMSGAPVTQLAAQIRGDCSAYLPELRRYLELNWYADTNQSEPFRWAENAVMLLAQGDERCRAELREKYLNWTDAYRALEAMNDTRVAAFTPALRDEFAARSKVMGRLLRLRGEVLDALARVGDARLRDSVLERFDDENATFQLIALRYFKTTAPDDPWVLARIRLLHLH